MNMLFYTLTEYEYSLPEIGVSSWEAAEIARLLDYGNNITNKDFVSEEIVLPHNFSMS